MKITRARTDHLRVPLGKSSRIPLTDPKRAAPDAADLILVHLETDTGLAGLGFTYLVGPGAAAVRGLIDVELAPLVVGEGGWVGVAADGRFDLGTAQALAHFFEDVGIDWFEDPIPAADEPGYEKLAGLMEVPLAVGSSFDSREQFFRVIRSDVVRTVRPDVCRLGGITPVLKVAAVAEAFQVAVSPVRL